jgi:hypothetical protein
MGEERHNHSHAGARRPGCAGRAAGCTVIALVWLLVAGLGAEYYLRWSQARHDAAGAALRSRMDAEACPCR